MNELRDKPFTKEFSDKHFGGDYDRGKRKWASKRIRFNIFGFNFHLFRTPYMYRLNSFDSDLFWEDKPNNPPFGKGITDRKWHYRISRVCPLQLKTRNDFDDICYRIKSIPERINLLYYKYVKCVIHPYNVIKISTLERTYNEWDTRLEHGVFQILTEYVESNPEETTDFSQEPWKSFWEETKYLYNWWKNRDKWEASWEDRLNLKVVGIEKYAELEKEKEKEFDDILIRIIKVRKGFWT
jgi:hypothetical protein